MSARVVRTPLERAARADATRGRTIYAIGDVQGRYDLLTTLLEAIVDDLGAAPAEGAPPLIVFCGGFIDHGPASAQVLAALVWLSRHAPAEIAVLHGAGERALLAFVDRPDALPAWLALGGGATLSSFGIDVPDADDARALAATRDALLDRLPASQLALLRAARADLVCGDYAFAADARAPGDATLVHGSGDGSASPQLSSGRIGIDTAANRTGVLTALRLHDDTGVFLHARCDGESDDVDRRPPPDADVVTMRDALTRFRPGY